MSQSNLLMIPIDESILLPMESLDQHLADAFKPSKISPILRNLLLQYGEPAFELLNYSETLPQEPVELTQEDALSQEQIGMPQANILLNSESIVLPLGIPPYNYDMHDVSLEGERQEIGFIRRSIPEKRSVEKTQTIENGLGKIYQEVKIKSTKRSKMSIDQIAEKIAMSQTEIKEPIPSTSTAHDIKMKQDTEHISIYKKKSTSKKRSKSKEISKDHGHDKEAKKKKSKKDSLDNDKEPKKKKSKKDPGGKESEKIKGPNEAKERKSSRGKKTSSKKRKSKDLPLQAKESTEPLVNIEKETSSTKGKKSIKRQSSNVNLSKSEKESNLSNSSPAKRPRQLKPDITDPIYLEPFKYGWIREVVYRSMQDANAKIKKADTYYCSPEGKKYRTLNEMAEILSRHNHLTEDNFTYLRIPIGINDPTKEVVRDSYRTTRRSRGHSTQSQRKDSSQKDTNASLNNSEQNSDFAVTENVEDTSINITQLEKANLLDETKNHEATIEYIAEPIQSVNKCDTTAVECNSNSTEKPKETSELDNDECIENEETSNQRISPKNVKMNSVIQSQFNNIQNDNENQSVSDGECNFENVNLSFITNNINHTTENSEVEPIKSIDLVNHLDKEIRSSSFNNVAEEVDSNKECESSDAERKLNEYSDDSNECDYKLESEPEKNLEELNSSFSEKMFISETLVKNNGTAEIKSSEENISLQKIGTENLTTEQSQSNLDCTKSIDTEVKTSKDFNLNKISVPKSSSTSPDGIKVSIIDEKTNSLKEIEIENRIIGNTSQNDLNLTRNIDNELEMFNDSISDNISLSQNMTTSSDTTKVSATSEKIKSLINAETENLITETISQSNLNYVESIDSVIEVSNDLKSDEVRVLESSLTSLDPVKESAKVVDEKTNSLQKSATYDLTNDDNLSNLGHTRSIGSTIKVSSDLNSDEILVPQISSILSEAAGENTVDEKINTVQIIDTNSLTNEKKSQSNLDFVRSIANELEIQISNKESVSGSLSTLSHPLKISTIDEKPNLQNFCSDTVSSTVNDSLKSNSEQITKVDKEIEIPYNLKSDEVVVPKSSTLSVLSDVSAIEKETKYNKFDAGNVTTTNTLQNNDLQLSNIDSAMEFIPYESQSTLTTTLSVTSSDSLIVSLDSAISTSQSSHSDDLSRTTLSSSATSQSLSSDEVTSASTNETPKSSSESVISIETSLNSLIFTKATVSNDKTISSCETLSIPLDKKKVIVSEDQTSKAENIEKLICMPDIKDGFDDIKTSLTGGIKKVDQELCNSSESYSDSAENTYLVNTKGSRFSFTTASFKQSKQSLPNEVEKPSVSRFNDDINCMKTIAESIKTLSLPSDLTNKQYFMSCSGPQLLSSGLQHHNSCKNFNETKFDNINLNVKQISSQEENFEKKPCVSHSKDNISKTDTTDCIQKVKSPSIVELDNSILNKNQNLISEKSENSNVKKMNTDGYELSNSSVKSLEDSIKSIASKSEYQSSENNSQEFVRSQSYEYQNSSRDDDNLDDTVSTLSGNSNEDNSIEHTNLLEINSMTKYEDYLISNEFSEMIDELAEKNEPTPDNVGVTSKSVELHDDLCEFIKLPPKKFFRNKQLVSSEQKQKVNKSNEVISNAIFVATGETLVQIDYNNVTNNLAGDKSMHKETCASQTIEESNLSQSTTLPPQKLLKNTESNAYKFAEKNISPVLTNLPTTVLKTSIVNNHNSATNNESGQNLQKLALANQAVAERRYSFDCSADILVELNELLDMSNENEHDINQSVNVSPPRATKLEKENSKLKDISKFSDMPNVSCNISSTKLANQLTPLSSSKQENKKVHFHSRVACPHSMASFCAGYSALKHIFKYLNFEDLLIAMDVCSVWKEIAQQLHLWKTVRIRNSQLTLNLANILQHYRTEHLLVVEEDNNDWRNFINILPEIKSLRIIELCPCPAVVFEEIVKNCPQLKIVNALSLKDDSINVESIQNLCDPEKLYLGGVSSMSMEGDLSFLSGFSKLTHLSLRSIKDLGKKNINVLQSLQELQSLELGECSELINTFGSTTLVELKNLQRLRLEKVEGSDCCTDILTSVSKIEKLTELELVNIEISKSFLKCLPKCQNIKKLLVIPMYRKRIAFSNNVIIKCTARMQNLLRFVWGIPEEFVQRSKSYCKRPYDDCISVLKPIPFQKVLDNIEPDYADNTNPTNPAIEMDTLVLKMLPLNILRKLYAHVLPNTQIDILKIPVCASWNLSIT